MTRKYEIVYIFDSALEESQINETLEPLHELLKTPDAPTPVTASSHWGKRTLAYEVAGKSVGYYVIVRFETDPTTLTEFERPLTLEARILRYLIVVEEGLKPLVDPSEAEAQAAEARPGENKPGEKTAEAKPGEDKPVEKTAEAKPAEDKPEEKTAEDKPTEDKPETKTAEAATAAGEDA